MIGVADTERANHRTRPERQNAIVDGAAVACRTEGYVIIIMIMIMIDSSWEGRAALGAWEGKGSVVESLAAMQDPAKGSWGRKSERAACAGLRAAYATSTAQPFGEDTLRSMDWRTVDDGRRGPVTSGYLTFLSKAATSRSATVLDASELQARSRLPFRATDGEGEKKKCRVRFHGCDR